MVGLKFGIVISTLSLPDALKSDYGRIEIITFLSLVILFHSMLKSDYGRIEIRLILIT